MTFTHYSVEELRQCGKAFVRDFKKAPRHLKSKHILRWFAAAAPAGIEVYGRYVNNYEYVVDQCHTTFPKPDGKEPCHKIWSRALKQPLMFRLALESEWGKAASHNLNLCLVLNDAWKVAFVKANVKVVVFATTTNKKALPIIDCLEKVRCQSDDAAPWLCIDIPWSQKEITPRKIIHRILGG